MILTTNELVDRTRIFKSNAFRIKKTIYEKNAPKARCFMKKMCNRQDL